MKTLSGLIVVLLLVAGFAVHAQQTEKFTVLIDVAHGGKDTGVQIDGQTEKDLTARIASQLKAISGNEDIAIYFTREEDKFVTLQERVTAINSLKPDMVLSLHLNGTANTDKFGMEFFVPENDAATYSQSRIYADMLSVHFAKQNYTVAGVKEAPMYVLKHSQYPVVLCELGYLTNSNDRSYLTNTQKQKEIASTLLAFIKQVKNG
jgi:N-acetylmuramoyl-L-alanine amidase